MTPLNSKEIKLILQTLLTEADLALGCCSLLKATPGALRAPSLPAALPVAAATASRVHWSCSPASKARDRACVFP